MTLRQAYRPLRPDLESFLFAAVGEETGGLQLSVVSALARLGLDPWDEAGRLSAMRKGEAVEQLARLIAELPGINRSLPEARRIAGGLVELLPKRGADAPPPLPGRRRRRAWKIPWPGQPQYWVICLVLGAAALISMIAHGGFPFGVGNP